MMKESLTSLHIPHEGEEMTTEFTFLGALHKYHHAWYCVGRSVCAKHTE